MNSNAPISGAAHDIIGAGLEIWLDEEERRLNTLKAGRMSWRARWQQWRTVQRARRVLDWYEHRTQGRDRHIVRTGVFGYGLAMFVSMEVMGPLLARHPPRSVADFVTNLVIGAIIWPLAGWWFGARTWSAAEREYDEARRALGLDSDAAV